MTFEQHPEIFFGLVAIIGAVGGWTGTVLRESLRNWKERRWPRQD